MQLLARDWRLATPARKSQLLNCSKGSVAKEVPRGSSGSKVTSFQYKRVEERTLWQLQLGSRDFSALLSTSVVKEAHLAAPARNSQLFRRCALQLWLVVITFFPLYNLKECADRIPDKMFSLCCSHALHTMLRFCSESPSGVAAMRCRCAAQSKGKKGAAFVKQT